uniref:probable hexosyltransferase MUCI70 n=1 Tax=Erigeron canadensis TaxID=72917 RepID=UPI001CB9809F|nr:probable hexosyltransferase MUCI70 [Erigeron canadensis]
MTSGSLGLRSSSYGSLVQHQQQQQLQQQQLQNGGQQQKVNQSTPPIIASSRKASKMFVKEKENMFIWMFKFVHRKKVGMLLLCLVSIVAMLWVLYVGKGEVTQVHNIQSLEFKNNSITRFSPMSVDEEKVHTVDSSLGNHEMKLTLIHEDTISMVSPPPPPPPPSLPMPPPPSPPLPPLPSPPPPVYFTGYTLPHGHPCETFTMPPPPADKKRTGPRPCPVCYLPVEEAVALMPKAPSFSPVLQNLTYIHEENLIKSEFGGSEFGGYPSLKQRFESYDIKESMSVHCGFVRGDKPGRNTGFDIDDSDLFEMEECRGVVVASAIFGAYDLIQQPKNISETAKKLCFFMFVDEETARFLRNSSALDDSKRIGLWRIVVVHNLPYTDPRRNGKIPKLLLHRLFPNVRYSLWVDGKLELVVDPYQILERFLWRKNASFAISRHYKRFDVFEEAEANKAASKYDNASIDFQINFYKTEGLTPYSDAKLPIRSDVPEGCVIIREHIPISNLFTCLWFNEVDRFTSRDQISFSTVRDKITSKTNWTVHMFWDCQRRNFVVQGYHRDILEHWAPPPSLLVLPSPPPPLPPPPPNALPVIMVPPSTPVDEKPKISALETSTEHIVSNPTKVPSTRRRRDRRIGSRRHRKVSVGISQK